MTELFGFDRAMKMLKVGGLLRRNWWSADTFIYLVHETSFTPDYEPLNKMFASHKELSYDSHIDICEDGKLSKWTHSDGDLLADDWLEFDVLRARAAGKFLPLKPEIPEADDPLPWPLNEVSRAVRHEVTPLDGLSFDDLESAVYVQRANDLNASVIIAISYSDLQHWVDHIPDYGDHYASGTSSAILEHGYLGRLKGVVVCTDAYLPPKQRFIKQSIVC